MTDDDLALVFEPSGDPPEGSGPARFLYLLCRGDEHVAEVNVSLTSLPDDFDMTRIDNWWLYEGLKVRAMSMIRVAIERGDLVLRPPFDPWGWSVEPIRVIPDELLQILESGRQLPGVNGFDISAMWLDDCDYQVFPCESPTLEGSDWVMNLGIADHEDDLGSVTVLCDASGIADLGLDTSVNSRTWQALAVAAGDRVSPMIVSGEIALPVTGSFRLAVDFAELVSDAGGRSGGGWSDR